MTTAQLFAVVIPPLVAYLSLLVGVSLVKDALR